MDGTIRDLAALRGTYRIIPETEPAVRLLFSKLLEMKVESVHVLLDEPVSNSGRLKTLIAEIGEEYRFSLDIQILKDVDRVLYEKENVITSDSVILDHCGSWINLTRYILEKTDRQALCVWGYNLGGTSLISQQFRTKEQGGQGDGSSVPQPEPAHF